MTFREALDIAIVEPTDINIDRFTLFIIENKDMDDERLFVLLRNILEDTYSFNHYSDTYLKICIENDIDVSIYNNFLLDRSIKFSLYKVVRVLLSSPKVNKFNISENNEYKELLHKEHLLTSVKELLEIRIHPETFSTDILLDHLDIFTQHQRQYIAGLVSNETNALNIDIIATIFNLI